MARLIPILLALAATPAWAESYDCTVEDFVGFLKADEVEFVAANKAKRFALIDAGDVIEVQMRSDRFTDVDYTYDVTSTGFTDRFALERGGDTARTTLALPKSPTRAIEKDGFFHASIVLQSNFIANSWLLRCE